MLMVHIMLSGYFPCSDSKLEALDSGLARLASESRRESPAIPLRRQRVAATADSSGNIYMDFGPLPAGGPLIRLYGNVMSLVNDASGTGAIQSVTAQDFRPRLPLMQFANLPAAVFEHAQEFAQMVVEDTGVPESTTAWRLMLAKFESQAAGEDWQPGSWAADISWELLSSHPL